jgi:hypothetical protein
MTPGRDPAGGVVWARVIEPANAKAAITRAMNGAAARGLTPLVVGICMVVSPVVIGF